MVTAFLSVCMEMGYWIMILHQIISVKITVARGAKATL